LSDYDFCVGILRPHEKIHIRALLSSVRREREDINTNDTSTLTHNQISDSITARQLNYQVTSLLTFYSSYLNNKNVRSLLLVRNDGQE
jgi:hypothetical protein